jgi:nucleotide-binding universal stress UspA family protein
MFNRILMAYDRSAESGRALRTGVHLAKALNAELRAVSVKEKLPPARRTSTSECHAGPSSCARTLRSTLALASKGNRTRLRLRKRSSI